MKAWPRATQSRSHFTFENQLLRSPGASQKEDRQSEEINQQGAEAAAGERAKKGSFFTWQKSKHTW